MLRMPMGQVKPGMVLAAPVPNPKQMEYDLLRAGFELTEPMIARLCELGVRTVWVSYPSLDFLDEIISPKLTQEQQNVYRTMKDSFARSQRHVVARIDFQEYRRTLSELVSSIAMQGVDTLLMDPLVGGSSEGDLFLHSSNVCYLSLMLGVKLGHYLVQQRSRLDPRHARDVMNLGLGALLHDVGKINLAREVQNFDPTPGQLPPQEWQDHTQIGYELIRPKLEPSASQVALHHHQQWNGEGFPEMPSTGRPLSRERIHIFSRIVAVANWYDRLVQQSSRQGLPAIAAIKQMRGQAFRGVFDPVVFRTFCDLVPPFPIGSLVELSDGTQAAVLIHNPDEPCLPRVRRISEGGPVSDDQGESQKAQDIDLSREKDLVIVSSEGCDVEPFLFSADEGLSDAPSSARQSARV